MVVRPILLFIFLSIITIIISKILNLSHTTDHLVELVWSVSPILMLLLISSLSLFYTYELEEEDCTAGGHSVDITVIGYQWGWNYEVSGIVTSDKFLWISSQGIIYFDNRGPYEFYPAYPTQLWRQRIFEKHLQPVLSKITRSIKPFRYFDWNCSYCIDALEPTKSLVIDHPSFFDKFEDYSRIILSLTRSDVLHSWYVPKLGVKIDAVPGQISKVNILFNSFRSVSYGRCTEVCGPFHSMIPIKVIRLFPNYQILSELTYYPGKYDLWGRKNPKYVDPKWYPPISKFVEYCGGCEAFFNNVYAMQRFCKIHLNKYVDNGGQGPVNQLACLVCPVLDHWIKTGTMETDSKWKWFNIYPLAKYYLREAEWRRIERWEGWDKNYEWLKYWGYYYLIFLVEDLGNIDTTDINDINNIIDQLNKKDNSNNSNNNYNSDYINYFTNILNIIDQLGNNNNIDSTPRKEYDVNDFLNAVTKKYIPFLGFTFNLLKSLYKKICGGGGD